MEVQTNSMQMPHWSRDASMQGLNQPAAFETRQEIGTGSESAVFLIKDNGLEALKVYTSPP
jgi:hypothetical protein